MLQHNCHVRSCQTLRVVAAPKPCPFEWDLHRGVSAQPLSTLLSLSDPSQPTLRDYQNGDGFGYILSFRKKGTQGWLTARVPHAESLHYVYRNESIGPYTPFEVKIKAYNRKGEGPESLTAIVYSAEEGKQGCGGSELTAPRLISHGVGAPRWERFLLLKEQLVAKHRIYLVLQVPR